MRRIIPRSYSVLLANPTITLSFDTNFSTTLFFKVLSPSVISFLLGFIIL